MKSIKIRTVFYVFLLLLLFFSFLEVMTNSYYERFYNYKIKQQLKDHSIKLEFLLTEINVSADKVINDINYLNDFEAILLNKNFEIIGAVNQCLTEDHLTKNNLLVSFARNNVKAIEDKEIFFQNIQLKKILASIFAKKIDDNYLILMKPKLLNLEAQELYNQFIARVCLTFMVLITPIVYMFSKSFSTPLVKMNQSIESALNDNDIHTIDYIGGKELTTLADNINQLTLGYTKLQSKVKHTQQSAKEEASIEDNFNLVKRGMLSVVSHEFKNFLAINQGYIESLKYIHGDNPEKRKKYFDIILDESAKMYELVKNLLDINAYQLGAIKLQMKSFNISNLVEDVTRMFKPHFIDDEIDVELYTDDSCLINADYLKIEQVIKNYITNAIAHVNTKGQISIRVIDKRDRVRVSVFNTGKKICDDEIDLIWNNYYRSDKARNKKGGSFGLGLSIVKHILKLHNGLWGVVNMQDGVEFYFELNKVNNGED